MRAILKCMNFKTKEEEQKFIEYQRQYYLAKEARDKELSEKFEVSNESEFYVYKAIEEYTKLKIQGYHSSDYLTGYLACLKTLSNEPRECEQVEQFILQLDA